MTRVTPVLSRRQTVVVVVVAVLALVATGLLVFGPGRGAREDIGAVQTDLEDSRRDLRRTLRTARSTLTRLGTTLRVVEESLVIQRQGLDVATQSQDIAGTALGATLDIRRHTSDTLSTLRAVITALGPLQELRGDLTTVVDGVEAGVSLARSTLGIAEQTLDTGRSALAVAATTLDTLEQSRDIQIALLRVGRRTLNQATEINRKIPFPPVFPTRTP